VVQLATIFISATSTGDIDVIDMQALPRNMQQQAAIKYITNSDMVSAIGTMRTSFI